MNNILLMKFIQDIRYITKYYKKLITKTKNKEIIGSINEWLVDNYYIISEQEKYIRNDFNNKNAKDVKNKKQLYQLIDSCFNESSFKLDFDVLFKKLNDYQEQNNYYFTYSEINFIRVAIRLVLISKLSKLCKDLNNRLNVDGSVKELFNRISQKIRENDEFELEEYINLKDNMLNNPYYIEQLNYKLKGLGRLSESAFVKLNELLIRNKVSLKDVIKKSHNEIARDNFLMMNIFNSLKKIAKCKLEYLYENISYTEKVLISEKVNIYSQVYDNNKIEYRNKIIKNAKKLKTTEYQYASDIVKKANHEKKHIGWYLFNKHNTSLRTIIYISSIVVFTLLISFFLARYLGLGLFLIIIIPISSLVIEIINQILMNTVKPTSLFKLKFDNDLPEEYSTMVVIPTIVKDKNKVNKMFEKLEAYYLSNKVDNLYFTLLGDASSESEKDVPYDEEVIEAGLRKVSELNAKYEKKIFNFAYRRRFYNESEECYLGFERKRGALIHFNKLLLNKLSEKEKKEYFKIHTFDGFDAKIKYVITLDADTKLVLNTALTLIGAMAHPLNRPILNKEKTKVIGGYGVMQPRVAIDVEVTNKSKYSQLFAGLGGLDIYVTASFDLYQDVFKEGSFVGKGIYDLEVFDQVLAETFPNNLILSHDLIEGNYLRCGFVNDVVLYDDYPSAYLNDAIRHHRWNRGDWQVINWLGKKVKNAKGKIVRNPIGLLSKWKIFDNLRRSLNSLFLLLILFFGLIFGTANGLAYLSLVVIIIAIPIFFYLISKVIYRNRYDMFLKYYLNLIRGIIAVINKSFIMLAILPYEAYLYVDSAVKALYRMCISKKNLLNWVTAEEVERLAKNDLMSYVKSFWINYVCALLLIWLTLIFKPNNIVMSSVIALIWIFAPVLMSAVSKKIKSNKVTLDEEQKEELKELAYKTWKYFEDLLTPETNYLIPDNYQCNRAQKIVYRTSPTNIGFSLISILSAVELEMITHKKALDLITKIIMSVEKLEKWNGHLYNWYDTSNLKKLAPYFVSSVDNGNFIASLYVVKAYLEQHGEHNMAYGIKKMIDEMDFSKLYNSELDVFSIGYNDSEKMLSPFHYNNFASEARLTSFIAIAKGDVPYKHWFCLDKSLTKYKFYKGVVSWSGTSFEYFMPLIFMRTFEHTLLDESYFFAYYTQREFIRELDPSLPWGMSESAYNELDDSENYKYYTFGIPYLKLQDSQEYPIVLSPYSSIMAISVDDQEVYRNIKKFIDLKMMGVYGLYESYDHEDGAVVQNYYAHHQGMILASLTNYLKNNVIQNYFHSNKNIEAYEMLLKEKVQIKTYIDLKIDKYKKYQYDKEVKETDVREYDKPQPIPEMGVLSNGSYTVLINDRGIGFSKYRNLQINRYRQVADEDYGIFVYVRNLSNGKLWSNTYAPLDVHTDKYKVIMASDRIKYVREDDGIVTTTEVTVTRDHNAEIRRITFQNNTNKDVTLEITSYGEVIICRNEEDIAHRTFNNLTIYSDFDEETSSLIFSRKSRTKENTKYYIVNRLFSDTDDKTTLEFETSREKFIGRNNTLSNPDMIMTRKKMSNKVGASLEPIMSIRKQVKINAKSKKSMYLLVGFGKSREQVMDIVNIYKDELSINKAFEMTTVLNNISTGYANLTAHQKSLYASMLKYIYQSIPYSEERKNILQMNSMAVNNLWKFGISGDWPIILVEIDNIEDVGFIKEVLQAYEFYKNHGLGIDIIILNNEDSNKEKSICDYINNLMYRINSTNYFDNIPGNVYVISTYNIIPEEKILLKTVATIILNASIDKTLSEQIYQFGAMLPNVNKTNQITTIQPIAIELPKSIEFYNGYGGFDNNGKEYVIDKLNTPMPWANVIANKKFGTVITNNLGGFSYIHNSRELKLTAWSNDIVSDPATEAIYINSEKFIPSVVKHGFGYTVFEGKTKEYDVIIKIFVGCEDSIKLYEVKVINNLADNQKLQITFAPKMVLGVTVENTSRYLLSRFDENDNRLYINNKYSNLFQNINVFLSSTEPIIDYNTDTISTKSITVNLNLKKNEEKTFAFMLGCEEEGKELVKYQDINTVKNEFNRVINYWNDNLSVIKVNTPDKAFDYMINGWYLYQAYTSRLLARAGVYQVGGATGFRDQLQDSMGVIYSEPELTRRQILEHARHQFKEGDVLHWWHKENQFGVRTKFTDDYLWLVYVTFEYLKITQDYSILNEEVCFATGPELEKNEVEKGISYSFSEEKDTLYNHLKLCIEKALNQFGRHQLPLMGCGDWNDGMNRVGYKGEGESVFVGFFLYDVLGKMANISQKQDDNEFASKCREKRETLGNTLNINAWDGAWYLRAYFDNGDPLGSRNNLECQIDLLSQSWSILTGVADEEKRKSLLNEVETRLVDKEHKIIKLLTPAFKKSKNNPGYIQDYLVGTRENGGQYTHAALWYVLALLENGNINQAYEYYQMINPINHSLNTKEANIYKVEPYVIAADVYSNTSHLGRGGWTWYTGSASWAYKIGIESILGFKKSGDTLTINPKINSSWDRFEINYRYMNTNYIITVINKDHVSTGRIEIKVDGKVVKDNLINLVDDKKEHKVEVIMKEDV